MGSVSDFRVFPWILEYIHIHDVVSWGWGPGLNVKFINVHMGLIHRAQRYFVQYFIESTFAVAYCVILGMEFSTRGIMPLLRKFWVLEHFGFQIL
jgi:hypothetical protein